MSRTKTIFFLLTVLALALSSEIPALSRSGNFSNSCDSATVFQDSLDINFRELPEHSFIKYEDNIIEYPAGRANADSFYCKLTEAVKYRNRKINILHIGGSHIQAGYFSHRMRTNMASLGKGISKTQGMLFPFKVMRTNAPSNYTIKFTGKWSSSKCTSVQHDENIGVLGAAVTTADSTASLSLSFTQKDSIAWNFNRLRITGYSANDSICPYAVYNGDTIMPVIIREENSYILDFPETAEHADIRFRLADNGSFTLTGIFPESDGSVLTYHSTGINGAHVPAWLSCNKLEQELDMIKPDMVIFGIGINDANVPPHEFNAEEFKNNYRTLIGSILKINPSCALLFITNNDCYLNIRGSRNKRNNPNTAKVEKAFMELAEEYNAAVWNQYRIMGGKYSSSKWRKAGLMRPDRIHFTSEGYYLLGDMLFNAILTDYQQHSNGI